MQDSVVTAAGVSRFAFASKSPAAYASQSSLISLYAWLVFFSVFISAIQLLVIIGSAVGPFINQVGSLSIIIVAFIVAFQARRHAQRAQVPFAVENEEAIFSPRSERILYLVVCALLLGFILIAFSGRDLSWDGNAYHILPINQWSIKNRIHEVSSDFTASVFMNGYPKGAEVVTFVFVQALGSWCLTGLALLYAPLGIFGTAVLCRLYGGTAKQSFLFGALYLLVPANVVQYGTTYVDAAFGFSVAALLALLACRFVVRGQNWLIDVVPVGCAMGAVLAVKTSGIAIVAVSCASFLFCSLFAGKKFTSRSRSFWHDFWWLSSCVIVAVAIGGFWYLRNWFYHGSPLYPAGLAIAGKTVWPGLAVSEVLSEMINTPPKLREFHPLLRVLLSWSTPLAWTIWGSKEDIRLGGLGLTWVLGCVPTILGAMFLIKAGRVLDPDKKIIFVFLALAVTLAFLATPMNWWARYTVWLYVLGLPTCWIVWAGVRHSNLRRIVRSWAIICAIILVVQSTVILVQRGRYVAAVAGFRLKPLLYDVVTGPLPLFPSMKSPLLSRLVTGRAAIGIGPASNYENNGMSYNTQIYGQLTQPVGHNELIPISGSVSATDLRHLSRDTHVKYVLWPIAQPVPAVMDPHVTVLVHEEIFMILELREDSFD